MTQTVLSPIKDPDLPVDMHIRQLAQRYRAARGLGLQILSAIGTPADGLLDQLPKSARHHLDQATVRALELSFSIAASGRGHLPKGGKWLTRALSAGTGAAGGFGGMPTALAELPVTTTVILGTIQNIACEYGFDPAHDDTRFDCLQIFTSAGPLAEDDSTDMSFLTIRIGLTGATLHSVIKQIAPRLAVVLGQKLAAQTVPVLGAILGAGINYAFTSYYQEMAHVSFGLRKLAEDSGQDRAALIAQFRQEVRSKR